MGRVGILVAIAAVASAAAFATRAPAARPMLYWVSAPPSGTRILLVEAPRTLRVSAAAADRRSRVRLSLLGATPVRIRARAGNPAVATLRFPPAHDLRLHTFVVTVVARSSLHRAVIERTVIVSVRADAVSLTGRGSASRWAYVRHAAAARRAPSPAARIAAPVAATTSDATPNVVRLLAERRTRSGLWFEVSLTALPNGRTGWLPRSALSVLHVVHTRIVVDTRRFTLTLFRNGRPVFRAPVGVGAPQWPTPRGTFYIRERLSDFSDPFYGPIAFGTSARSPTLTDWPGGGIVGIHGTNRPSLIPGRISHGCIRLRNADIVRLARLLPLGTPVEIR